MMRPIQKLQQSGSRFLFFSFLFLGSLFSNQLLAEQLVLATASSMKPLAQGLAQAYQTKQPTRFAISSASSGTITSQIKQKAPFDLFFAAGEKWAIEAGASEILELGSAQLVIASKNPLPPFEELKGKRIALANPVTAPVGEKAWRWLEQQRLAQQTKVVRANNAQQALQMLETGSVEIAFASKVQTLNSDWVITELDGVEVKQYLALLNEKQASKAFFQWVKTGGADEKLASLGFSPAERTEPEAAAPVSTTKPNAAAEPVND